MKKIRWASMKSSEDILVDRGIWSRKKITKGNLSSSVFVLLFCFCFFLGGGALLFLLCFFLLVTTIFKGSSLTQRFFFVNTTKYFFSLAFYINKSQMHFGTFWNIKIERSDWWTFIYYFLQRNIDLSYSKNFLTIFIRAICVFWKV